MTPPIHPDAQTFLDREDLSSFYDGSFHPGSAKEGVIDPATGSPITHLSMSDKAQVAAAVASADQASAAWSALSPDDRAAHLSQLADAIESHVDALSDVESLDVGKTLEAAKTFDIPFGAECFRYYASVCREAEYETQLTIPDMEARVSRTPYGVCGFILPWNFPFTLMCWGIAPALAAGNTVVVKISEVTPLSSLYFASILEEAGIPSGVINFVVGEGSVVGDALIRDERVKRVSFTGSSAVGKAIAKICGDRLVPAKLELGGKGAAVVYGDADVSKAAEGLAGAITANTGQVCCTATRWFIHEDIYDEFVEKVTPILKSTKIGAGRLSDTQMGPLVSKQQKDRVLDYYNRGVSAGADPVVPCEPVEGADGYFVTPHLLAGETSNICYQEEIFGPTAYLVKFSDTDDIAHEVNSLNYGLANSVWSNDLEKADQLAVKLSAGNCWINAHNVFAYGLPYGGVNRSGMGGGVNSEETLYDYLQSQTIARPL